MSERKNVKPIGKKADAVIIDEFSKTLDRSLVNLDDVKMRIHNMQMMLGENQKIINKQIIELSKKVDILIDVLMGDTTEKESEMDGNPPEPK